MTPFAPAKLAPLLLTACTLQTAAPEIPTAAGVPVLHAIHDERLQQLMDEMNHLMFERMRTELELDRDRRRKTKAIAETAGAMLETLDLLPARLPQLGLRENERIVFLTLADALKGRTQTLEIQAKRNAVDSLPGTLEEIRSTCEGCHRLFRQRSLFPERAP